MMNYKQYFNKLIEKSNIFSNRFPRNYHFTHRENNYYADALSYKGVRFNYVVSSSRSIAFGENFEGLIVELYIHKDGYVDSYYNQLISQREQIENELNIHDLVWQPRTDTPKKSVSRLYAKKSVNIEDTSKWDEYIEWQVNTMVKFLEVLPKYIDRLKEIRNVSMGESEKEFRNKYKNFVSTLPLQKSGEYAKLYTESQNKPFKVNKNSSGSIVVRAFTQQSAPMVISENQLLKVLFNNGPYLYSSYEPVLINRINNELIVSEDEIVENTIDPSPLHYTKINKIKNIILYGSPGVGKTYNTKKIISLIESGQDEIEIFKAIQNNEFNNNLDANRIIENISNRVKFITFHQSFGYEDFIEGFRPNENGDIKLQDGIFKTICDDANNEREKNYYLVIDEINRGNISKIFGELITLIEEDKRDTLEVTLPYSKKPFKIPSNLYIIGTMNSTDKSIALIDIALRRRFTFLKMKPKADLIDYPKARQIFEVVNNKITETLGEDYQIGHSYFMKMQNDDDLDFVLEYKIIPLLEEYYYGDDRLTEVIALCKRDTTWGNDE